MLNFSFFVHYLPADLDLNADSWVSTPEKSRVEAARLYITSKPGNSIKMVSYVELN
jgi:hypothetical protein